MMVACYPAGRPQRVCLEVFDGCGSCAHWLGLSTEIQVSCPAPEPQPNLKNVRRNSSRFGLGFKAGDRRMNRRTALGLVSSQTSMVYHWQQATNQAFRSRVFRP